MGGLIKTILTTVNSNYSRTPTNTNNKISIAPKSGTKTCNQRRSVA